MTRSVTVNPREAPTEAPSDTRGLGDEEDSPFRVRVETETLKLVTVTVDGATDTALVTVVVAISVVPLTVTAGELPLAGVSRTSPMFTTGATCPGGQDST